MYEMSNNKPKIISLFTGCGGLDLGFHKAGYETVWANDFNEWACKTFLKNFPNTKTVHGDIEKINPLDSSIPDCDLILGGFPCQDFSMIWKRPGLNGERGNLYKSFVRFVQAKKPKAFIAENVKGILTANDKKAIQQIIKDFESIEPEYTVFPRLYNFAEYGVPQFRERVLIVGIRKDTGFDFKHPEPMYGPNRQYPFVTASNAFENVESVKYNNEFLKVAQKTVTMLSMIPPGGNFTSIPVDSEYYVRGMISHVYRKLHPNEPSKTLIASGGGGTWGYHYEHNRPLTNRERARIQSFPDDFIFEGSTTEVRRQIGNAVPPNGVISLAKALLPLFNNSYEIKQLGFDKKNELPFEKRLKKINSENATASI